MPSRDPLEDTPQILHIKRNVEAFTDIQEARTELRRRRDEEEPVNPSGRGILRYIPGLWRKRGRRGVFSLLIPLVVIAAASYFIMRAALPQRSDRAVIAGYTAELRETVLPNELQVSVILAAGDMAAQETEAAVIFQIPETKAELMVTSSLAPPGAVLTGRMVYSGAEKTLYAFVRIGTTTTVTAVLSGRISQLAR